jgi:hypothetical protein
MGNPSFVTLHSFAEYEILYMLTSKSRRSEGESSGQRVYAGVAGERETDGWIGLHHAHARRGIVSESEAVALYSNRGFNADTARVKRRRRQLLASAYSPYSDGSLVAFFGNAKIAHFPVR